MPASPTWFRMRVRVGADALQAEQIGSGYQDKFDVQHGIVIVI